MQAHRFTLILRQEPTPEQEDLIFELFEGDATVAVTNGVPVLYFTREAPSIEQGLRGAVRDLTRHGIDVERVEFAPSELEPA
ncbi:MAG TPA: hypothetical protein VFG50_00640 [Rhodothermales bacterium]|nr:hypothetical protein [Rhodothermales bacterium]